MGAGDWVDPAVDAARGAVAGEIGHWRRELTAPWREGREGRAAEVGRWIGFGLAIGALAAGIAAALRVDRPWE